MAKNETVEPLEGATRLEPMTPVILVFDPPAEVQKGDLRVHVMRTSKRRRETIELDLDAQVPGPGCFLG